MREVRYNIIQNIISNYPFFFKELITSLTDGKIIESNSFSISLLKKNRLIPIFYKNNLLEKTSSLKIYFQKNSLKNLILLNTIFYINSEFQKKKIHAIFLKGVVLSHQVYGDVIYRECRDIDILIDEINIEQTHQILIDNQYQLLGKVKITNIKYRKYFHNFSYWNPAKKISIELHWRPIYLNGLFVENNFSDLSKNIKVNNQEIAVFNNEYNLIYLCLHGAIHMFCELIWILDIFQFIKNQEIDWNKIDIIIEKYNIERPVKAALFLTNKLCNANIPDYYLEIDNKTFHLIRIILTKLPVTNKNLKYKFHKNLYFTHLKSGINFKWTYIKHRILRAIT